MKKTILYAVLFIVAIAVLTFELYWFRNIFLDNQYIDYSTSPVNPPVATDSVVKPPNNQIKIFTDINENLAIEVIAAIHQMEKDSAVQEIEILIDSKGGSTESSFWICYAIKLSKKPVRTIVIGEALSGAAVILSSGTRGRRLAFKNARILLHRPWLFIRWAQFRAEDLEERARKMRLTEQLLYDLLSENTGQPIEKLKQDLQKDFWLNYKQAIKYGLIDSLYQK